MEIARERLLAYATRPEQPALCLEILQPAGLVPRKATSVRSTEATVEMVRAGIDVAVRPAGVAESARQFAPRAA